MSALPDEYLQDPASYFNPDHNPYQDHPTPGESWPRDNPDSTEPEAYPEVCQGCGGYFDWRGGRQMCWKCKKR